MADVEVPNPEDIEGQKEDHFTRRVALVVACYAVVLAISSLGGSNAGKDMMLGQMQASNAWAYYQAKAAREHQCRLQRLRLEADMAALAPEARSKAESLLAYLKTEEDRYKSEKEEIEAKARAAEEQVKSNQAKDPYFDYAEVLLQIAIVTASVAMLARSWPMLGLSLLLALAGTFLTVNGFGMFVRVPFLGN